MATCLWTLPSNIWAGSKSGSQWAPEESCRAFLILFCTWVDTHPAATLEEVEQAHRFMRLAAITRIVEEKTLAESVRKERDTAVPELYWLPGEVGLADICRLPYIQCVRHRTPGGNTLLVLHGEKAARQAVLNSYLLPLSQSVNF